jgi:predicted phosphodiesterase
VRIGVVSDIHSNLAALETVVAAMQPMDEVWCLGDIVGYGPQPNECVSTLRGLKHLAVAGNHDWAATGRMGVEEFNPYAAAAALWTRDQLAPDTRDYLVGLPIRLTSGEFTLAHGSPRDPLWEYLLGASSAGANFAHFEGPFCLVGHTHVPAIFTRADDRRVLARRIVGDEDVPLDQPGSRYILNPGSVGQPRDGDSRAAFLVVDTDRRLASWRRVVYPIEPTQERMRRAGLPPELIERLDLGL